MKTAMRLCAAAAVALVPLTLSAQAPTSSTRAIGMGGAYTTLARGYEAVAWNPAQLGMPGRTGFSLNLVQVSLAGYSNALAFADFDRWSSGQLTIADKDSILGLIRAGDPDRPFVLGIGAEATGLSVSLGSFAVTMSGFGEVQTAVADDAVEIALFGNARRRAPGETYTFAGTGGTAFGGVQIAASYGRRLNVTPVGVLAVGGTVRYTRGVFVGRAQDLGSTLQNAPAFDATMRVHALVADVDSSRNNGRGLALDLGGTYEMLSGLRLGLVLENALMSFTWSDDNLLYYRYAYALRQSGDTYTDSTIAEIEGAAFSATDPVQAALRDSLFADAHPAARVRVGASMVLGGLVLAGDVAVRLRNGILDTGGKRVAVGGELTLIPVLRPRLGLATDLETGFSYAVGLGLALGPVKTDIGLLLTPGGSRKGFLLAAGFSLVN